MKGLFKSPNTTYHIDITGESWQQGDTVNVITKTSEPSSTETYDLTFAHVDLKKLKKNDPKAFQVIYQCEIAHESTEHQIHLAIDCPIQDGAKSTFLFIGPKDNLAACERMELPVKERSIYRQYIETIELFQRFKLKTLKNKTKALDAKLVPPQSKEYAGVDQLNIHFKTSDKIYVDFIFKVKKLSYAPEGVQAKSDKVSAQYTYNANEILQYGDTFNQERVRKDLEEAFNQCIQKTTATFL